MTSNEDHSYLNRLMAEFFSVEVTLSLWKA